MGYYYWYSAQFGRWSAFWNLFIKPSYSEVIKSTFNQIGVAIGLYMAKTYWLPNFLEWLGWG